MAYDKTNTGVLFVNKERKSDKYPNFRGTINVNGKDFEVAGWTRESKTGDKYLSLKIEEPRTAQKAEPKPTSTDLGDELPFSIDR